MATMTTDARQTKPGRKSLALETFLSSLEATEDLFSGSESSSLETSPIVEKDGYVYPPRNHAQVDEELEPRRGRERSRGADENVRLEPTQLVEKLLNGIDTRDAADDLLAEDAQVQVCSHAVSKHEQEDVHSDTAEKDRQWPARVLVDIEGNCRIQDLKIDTIFRSGDDVAAFGTFRYWEGSQGSDCEIAEATFSVWAKVDTERARIVSFRWMDQAAAETGESGPEVVGEGTER